MEIVAPHRKYNSLAICFIVPEELLIFLTFDLSALILYPFRILIPVFWSVWLEMDMCVCVWGGGGGAGWLPACLPACHPFKTNER